MKRKVKLIIDHMMVFLLPLLMAYSLIGQKFHEIVGTVMLVLFITHHVLNRKWYSGIFKGKYTVRRVFQTVLDILILVFMIAQPLSGILMSKYLYTFLPVTAATSIARRVHMIMAYWGFVLVSIHGGTHLNTAKLKTAGKAKQIIAGILTALACGYGLGAFIHRGFAGYMFGETAFAYFDYGEPVIFFLLDYLMVCVMFMCIGKALYDCTGPKKKQMDAL